MLLEQIYSLLYKFDKTGDTLILDEIFSLTETVHINELIPLLDNFLNNENYNFLLILISQIIDKFENSDFLYSFIKIAITLNKYDFVTEVFNYILNSDNIFFSEKIIVKIIFILDFFSLDQFFLRLPSEFLVNPYFADPNNPKCQVTLIEYAFKTIGINHEEIFRMLVTNDKTKIDLNQVLLLAAEFSRPEFILEVYYLLKSQNQFNLDYYSEYSPFEIILNRQDLTENQKISLFLSLIDNLTLFNLNNSGGNLFTLSNLLAARVSLNFFKIIESYFPDIKFLKDETGFSPLMAASRAKNSEVKGYLREAEVNFFDFRLNEFADLNQLFFYNPPRDGNCFFNIVGNILNLNDIFLRNQAIDLFHQNNPYLNLDDFRNPERPVERELIETVANLYNLRFRIILDAAEEIIEPQESNCNTYDINLLLTNNHYIHVGNLNQAEDPHILLQPLLRELNQIEQNGLIDPQNSSFSFNQANIPELHFLPSYGESFTI